ncbi:MAG: roadblock/LC7 domain-containing protein [Oleispira sp.]|nr:roadblock/LC7 domain-containing protein [Oleispira sp.]MBL4879952.1 roadblock/LC7 domain-containing protein [Oleispira sp.]
MKYPNAKQYIYLTHVGAHFVTEAAQIENDRKVLQVLIKCSQTPRLAGFLRLVKETSDKPALEHTISLFNKGYLVAKDQPLAIEDQPLELSFPPLLKELSDNQHCAICDQDGFLLSHVGFELEQAEQAALLAVEISGLQEKRQQNMQDLSGSNLSFISIIDNDGQSQLRFWPMYFNNQVFFLAIKGKPLLQHSSFTRLTWLLGQRYL